MATDSPPEVERSLRTRTAGPREPQAPGISVVIPVYNSEKCLDELARRLVAVLDNTGRSYEIILVNDYSPDGSWQKIVELCGEYDALKGISLRRNFGQDNALMAGLNQSAGVRVGANCRLHVCVNIGTAGFESSPGSLLFCSELKAIIGQGVSHWSFPINSELYNPRRGG